VLRRYLKAQNHTRARVWFQKMQVVVQKKAGPNVLEPCYAQQGTKWAGDAAKARHQVHEKAAMKRCAQCHRRLGCVGRLSSLAAIRERTAAVELTDCIWAPHQRLGDIGPAGSSIAAGGFPVSETRSSVSGPTYTGMDCKTLPRPRIHGGVLMLGREALTPFPEPTPMPAR